MKNSLILIKEKICINIRIICSEALISVEVTLLEYMWIVKKRKC